ncbi:Glycosyl transferase family protein [Rhodovastum atsumiense]|uniref:glycosyl transferase family protein n=1 Tax=Rhodovastum atsumiense TaxID=504468 RepID=UPI00139F2A9A|nr:glycosyl transferase family protein [Rhodovastum atsumiense]CAH2605023.1 Glycosyl transferase family protein [Rhodovastum atsumiense]
MPPETSLARFAEFVAALGRGPGKSRALTRDEAREAFTMALAGDVDPHQLGAFLMLLRYRGEDGAQIAGMVEAAQATLPPAPPADLDWPSYGAGRTRGLPWFLLAALALARSGVRVLMHGSNELGSAVSVADGLAALGLAPARDMDAAAESLDRTGFAYLPVATLAPALDRLLGLRRLFGLRSPVNTASRLLDPARAPAGVDGVFHPAYLDVHLAAAECLGRPRLLVLKGGGGEAERVPAKPGTAFLWSQAGGRTEIALPGQPGLVLAETLQRSPDLFAAVWHGEATPQAAIMTIQATIGLALLALGRAQDPGEAEAEAARIWADRR